jgi:hypothetical protein
MNKLQEAKDLDGILDSASNRKRIYSKIANHENEHEYFVGLAMILKKRGFANILTTADNHITLMIQDSGIAFVKQGGFIAELEEQERAVRQDRLTKNKSRRPIGSRI